MSTHAMDIATIIKIFITLKKERGIGSSGWNSINPLQKQIFEFYEKYQDEVSHLKNLNCNIGIDSPLEITATSTLDKSVIWKGGIAKESSVKCKEKKYPAFRLEEGCSVFAVDGFEEPLLMIETKSKDKLWILMSQETSGLDLARTALDISVAAKKLHQEYVWHPEAIIPKVDFKLEPNISFLEGANSANWSISKATQKFKFRMNEEGARAIVETHMVLFGCCVQEITKIEKIVIDKPFIGWFTQDGSSFPMAVFYADTDCWKDAGKLKDL